MQDDLAQWSHEAGNNRGLNALTVSLPTMALAMNTDRARALQVGISLRDRIGLLLITGSDEQSSIQKELAMKGYSTESDPVMAEYITIMLINTKTSEQITSELTDLIGPEYDPKFTDWLFAEVSSTEEAAETSDAPEVRTTDESASTDADASTSRQL